MGICRDETVVLRESEDVETDEICDAVYTIENAGRKLFSSTSAG